MSELTPRQPLRSKEGYGSKYRAINQAITFFTKKNGAAPRIEIDYFVYYESKTGLWYFVEIWCGSFK
jgi:hypothetical protein